MVALWVNLCVEILIHGEILHTVKARVRAGQRWNGRSQGKNSQCDMWVTHEGWAAPINLRVVKPSSPAARDSAEKSSLFYTLMVQLLG